MRMIMHLKKMFKPHCSIQQMALNNILSAYSTVKNTILYHSSDLSSYDQQYEKLLEFVCSASEPFKTQLTYFIYPMFVHIYLEFIVNDEKEMAQEFFDKHSTQFHKNDGYRGIVAELANILSVEDMQNHNYFKLFREDKFVVELTEDCMEYLLTYLKEMNHIAVLQLLNLYFSLECEGIETDHILESSCDDKYFDIPPSKEFFSTESVLDVKNLRDSINKVRNGPPCLPSTCIYNIHPGSRRFSSAAVSAQVALIACGFEESSVHIWDAASEGLPSHTCTVNSSGTDEYLSCESQGKALFGHRGPVYGMSFTPQGELLLSCSADTTVRAWRTKDFRNVAVYQGHCYPIWDIDVSPFALYFATASKDHTARLWMTEMMYPLLIFAGHNSDVDCVKFHPNCNYIATGSSDETIRLWNVQDGRMVRLFVGHNGGIHTLAFSPNGHYLASAGDDQTIKIWDIGSGSLIKDLYGHTDTICSLCFSNDGSLLASSGMENSIRLWDTSKDVECSPLLDNTPQIKADCSPELLSSFRTKSSIHRLSFGWRNILMGVGVAETSSNVSS